MSRCAVTFKISGILPDRSTLGNCKKVTPMRRAKIICTLGPASREPAFIGHLIDEGMNVARINFSHGDPDEHRAVIAAVRAEAKKRDRAVGILQDLQGPKIRVGRFVSGSIELEPGAELT